MIVQEKKTDLYDFFLCPLLQPPPSPQVFQGKKKVFGYFTRKSFFFLMGKKTVLQKLEPLPDSQNNNNFSL